MSCNSLTHNLRRRVSLISVMESKNSKGPSTFQCVTPDLAVVVLVLLSSNTTGFIFFVKACFQSSWLLGEWNNSFSACVDVNVLQYRTVHWNPNHNRVAVILALLWLFFHCVHMLLFAKWFCYSFFGNIICGCLHLFTWSITLMTIICSKLYRVQCYFYCPVACRVNLIFPYMTIDQVSYLVIFPAFKDYRVWRLVLKLIFGNCLSIPVWQMLLSCVAI